MLSLFPSVEGYMLRNTEAIIRFILSRKEVNFGKPKFLYIRIEVNFSKPKFVYNIAVIIIKFKNTLKL